MLKDGLVTAWHLTDGGARALSPEDLEAPAALASGGGSLWVHLDRGAPEVPGWLAETMGVPDAAAEALLDPDTRPRCDDFRDGVLVNLRGINLNPGADPDDMLSMRMWVTDHALVSLRRFPIMAANAVRVQYAENRGPDTIGDLVTELADRLTENMAPFLLDLDEQMDTLEETPGADDGGALRRALSELRRTIVTVRRFIAPQQAALARLAALQVSWLTDHDRVMLRHTVDTVTRYVEDLDALRERADILKDVIQQRLYERMNRNAYVLTVVAALFLPLGFLTGLLGINVGGIPGAENPVAFWIFCGLLVALVAALWAFMRWRRLI